MPLSNLAASIKNWWKMRNAFILPPGVTIETRLDPSDPSKTMTRVILDDEAAAHYGYLPVIPGGSNMRVVRMITDDGSPLLILRTGDNSATFSRFITTDQQQAADYQAFYVWKLWHQATRLRNDLARPSVWAPALSKPVYNFRPRIIESEVSA